LTLSSENPVSESAFKLNLYRYIAGANRASRLVVEECYKWGFQRKVFGKPLIEQPVIRNKLAQMTSLVEGVHAWWGCTG
jgi:alkylation response protein AidB-like acyl-CoA dehydrogenase